MSHKAALAMTLRHAQVQPGAFLAAMKTLQAA